MATEWGRAAKEDVADDTDGPDVALGAIVLVENLGGDIVGRAQLLIKLLVRVIDQRRSEVNDLDLIELLVLLEEDVLGL